MVRLRCSYQVTCSMFGKRFQAQVVDMGLEGMRLAMQCRVERGQLVGIQYDGPFGCYDFDTVQARVVWCRYDGNSQKSEVGVSFTHPATYLERSWVRHMLRLFDLDKMTVHDRRGHVRLEVECPVTATEVGGQARDRETSTILRDVGVGGALLESDSEFALGANVRLQLEIPGGILVSCQGRVVRKARAPSGRSNSWSAATANRRDGLPIRHTGRWLLGVRFAGDGEDLRACVGQIIAARAL